MENKLLGSEYTQYLEFNEEDYSIHDITPKGFEWQIQWSYTQVEPTDN